MKRQVFAVAALCAALHSSPAAARVQPAAGPSGHWEGAIQVPGQELKIALDLQTTGGKWEGTISIPAQGLKAFPLSDITVKGDTVTFAMRNVPGNPQFTATLAKDAKSLTGQLSQGGGTVPLSATRTGDAKIERPPDSTPVTKDIEGSWEGTLDVDGTKLRLVLKLANQPAGGATGTLVSLDQGGVEIPVATVVQSGSHLKVIVPTIVGNYEGDLKGGQLTGTWTQGPRSWPLVFTRAK